MIISLVLLFFDIINTRTAGNSLYLEQRNPSIDDFHLNCFFSNKIIIEILLNYIMIFKLVFNVNLVGIR